MSLIGEICMSRVQGGHCTVLGYGLSNRPLVAWLLGHGARRVTVRDRRPAEELRADAEAFFALRAPKAAPGGGIPAEVEFIGGEGYLSGLEGDIIFRSPGIRPDAPEIAAAVAAGAVLSSEMELFLALTPATVLGLSGSDGKTTSTTLTARILEAATARRGRGRVYLGGNIGTPLLPLVDDMTAEDFAVVELSSFQLMTLPPEVTPHRAAITNISPNHLNWHTDMAEYIAAKARILGGRGEAAALNLRDAHSRALAERLAIPVIWFTGEEGLTAPPADPAVQAARGDCLVYERGGTLCLLSPAGAETAVLDTGRIRLPGRHNLENYMTAIALTLAGTAPVDATPADIAAVADAFTGVPHRLELIREVGGVRFYNSSIDSSPSRSVAALKAMRELATRPGATPRRDPIVLCGGQDKHVPFDPFAEALCGLAAEVILTGEARYQILDALRACPDFDPGRLPVTLIPDYREAMAHAIRHARPGDTVLLSPACTSFDAFRNFEERGNLFRAMVEALPEPAAD